jgi:hypothetical protein
MQTEPAASRAEALRSGHQTFTTQKPCVRGHYSPRYARNGGCIACQHSVNTRRDRSGGKLTAKSGAGAEAKLIFARLDAHSEAMTTKLKARYRDILGVPISGSVLYRRAIRALNDHLNQPQNIANEREAVRAAAASAG